MRRLCPAFVLLALIVGLFWPAAVRADEHETRELRTKYFTILYGATDYRGAEWYAAVVDGVYDDLTELFGHHPAPPITLRFLPTIEAYARANPAGVHPGVLAHINTRDRELGFASSRLSALGGTLAVDTIRHELTHLIVDEISAGNLPIGFNEGIAQYVEREPVERERQIETLRRARSSRQLLSWQSLNTPERFYREIAVGYAQAYSVLAFLAEQPNGVNAFRQFVRTLGEGYNWPVALERAYGRSAVRLESEWRSWLPSFLDHGWRKNVLAAWDLGPALRQIAAGDYAAAEVSLEEAVRLAESLQRPARAVQARTALDQARAGRTATDAWVRAEERLAARDYAAAAPAYAEAAGGFERAGVPGRATLARRAREIALAGSNGRQHLTRAKSAAESHQYVTARAAAERAVIDLGAAGDTGGRAEAERIWETAAAGQRTLGVIALIAGAGLVYVLFPRRRGDRPEWIAQLTAERPAPRL